MLEYAEKHNFLAAIGCTRSDAIRSYNGGGGGNPYSPLIIMYEVSTMNIIWGRTWDRTPSSDCFHGGIFSPLPNQSLIIAHTGSLSGYLIVFDALTGAFKVAINYQNSVTNHPDGRFMVAKYQSNILYTVYASVNYVSGTV